MTARKKQDQVVPFRLVRGLVDDEVPEGYKALVLPTRTEVLDGAFSWQVLDQAIVVWVPPDFPTHEPEDD